MSGVFDARDTGQDFLSIRDMEEELPESQIGQIKAEVEQAGWELVD